MTLSIDQAVKAVDTLSGIDWSRMYAALQNGDVIGDLTSVEELAAFAAQFVPEAVYVSDAAELLVLIIKAKQAGYWAPAEPEDPAMERVEGSKSR